MKHLYPLLFEPNLHETVWGGDKLTTWKHLPKHTAPVGESWEVSAVPSSVNIISNGIYKGKDLISLIDSYPNEILGKHVAERYAGKMPLLVKFIDARHDLSIQVHPNDEMAQRVHGKFGKSEMWYVLHADPGASLYVGFKQEIDRNEYKKRIAEGTITDVLARHEVHAGDVFYLPAGRVHAICGGMLLAEALDYHVEKDYRTHYSDQKECDCTVLSTEYFSVHIIDTTAPFHRNLMEHDSFVIVMCLEGDCKIHVHSTGDEIELHEGFSCMIPAEIADYDLIPVNDHTKILDTYID